MTNKKLPQIVFLGGYSGSGKLIADYTKVLTTEGFKNADAITMEDTLIGDDGSPTKLLGIFPEKEPEMYRIHFSDKTHIDCCKDHLWEIQTVSQRQKNNSWVKNTLEIKKIIAGAGL